MTSSLIGQRLAGKYEVQAELGRGGMGVVYRGYDALLRRPVAIKLLAPYLSADPPSVERFRREAVLAANLHHPNVVTIFDVGQQGDIHYIVMELLPGVTLEEWLRRNGPMPLPLANQVASQVASALDYAHHQGMIHGDVKPANVMLDPTSPGSPGAAFQVKLMDFGLARAREAPAGAAQVSASGAGTLDYMAPEQVLGGPLDVRTDVYAFGVLLYRLLTGQTPFVRSEPLAVAYAHTREAPPSLRQLRGDLPKAVEEVVLKALAKQPDQRYQTAGQLAADFAAAAAGKAPSGLKKASMPKPVATAAGQAPRASSQSTAGPVEPAPQPLATPSDRRPLYAVFGVAAMLLLAVAAAILIASGSDGETPTPTALPAGVASTVPATESPSATSPRPAAAAAVIVVASATAAAPSGKSPTATLAPTPKATAIPTATLPKPTSTGQAGAAKEIATTMPLAAPRLSAPADSYTAQGNVDFTWQWEGALAAGQGFEVRIWEEGSSEHLGAEKPVTQPSAGLWRQQIDVDLVPAMQRGGSGNYWWTVAVVAIDPYARIGEEAPPRRLVYRAPSDAPAEPAPATPPP